MDAMCSAFRRFIAVFLCLVLALPVWGTHSCDNVGNLQTVTYPNGVVHNYTYDTQNRLTNLGVNGTVEGAPGAIASYAYTLDASGHRTAVTELSGRTVNYGYDAVGNRKQKVSTIPGYPGGLLNYNAND